MSRARGLAAGPRSCRLPAGAGSSAPWPAGACVAGGRRRSVLLETPPSDREEPRDLPPLPVGCLCPQCGYDLRGLTSARCPECGFDLAAVRSQESRIPWSYRRQLGWLRAYWKTVWLVLRRPREFCLEVARPVSYRDAQAFRWVTLVHAQAAVLAASLAPTVADWVRTGRPAATLWLLIGGIQVWALLALAALPGLASYWFHPRHLPVGHQNRAIALSYYAWTPLALALLTVPLGALWMVLCLVPYAAGLESLYWAGLGSMTLWVGTTYGCLWAFAKYTLHQAPAVRIGRMLALCLVSGLAVLLLALVPLSFFYLAVVFASLR